MDLDGKRVSGARSTASSAIHSALWLTPKAAPMCGLKSLVFDVALLLLLSPYDVRPPVVFMDLFWYWLPSSFMMENYGISIVLFCT